MSPLSVFLSLLLRSAVFGGSASSADEHQSNAERVIGGYYTPSHDYDLVHQRIEVKNFDWDSTSFDGKVTTTLVSLRPRLDSMVLDMGRRLAVRSVAPVCARGRSCTALAFARPGDSLVVRLRRPAGLGDTVRLTVDYHGQITQGRGLYFFKDEPGRPHRPQQVYSGGGTDGNPDGSPPGAARTTRRRGR